MTKHRKTRKEQPEQAPPAEGKQPLNLLKPTPPLRFKPKWEAEEVKPPNAVKRLLNFFKDARRELGRVTWPKRSETLRSTGVLLVLVAISAVYLALVDGILTRILRLIVG